MRNATKNSMNSSTNKKAREQAFKKLMAVSAVCTIALLAQAVFLLWSSATALTQDSNQFYGILTFLYLTEMPPSVIFVIMFKKASMFIQKDKVTTSTASATRETSLQPLDTASADMQQ